MDRCFQVGNSPSVTLKVKGAWSLIEANQFPCEDEHHQGQDIAIMRKDVKSNGDFRQEDHNYMINQDNGGWWSFHTDGEGYLLTSHEISDYPLNCIG